MKVLVSGATGMIGSELVPALAAAGHIVARLVRSEADRREGDLLWDLRAGKIDSAGLEGVDAAVHLAGENISEGRWNAEKKARILESRVGGTRLLSEALAGLARRPAVLLCASAVGYYGDRGDEVLSEESAPGTDFLANVCQEWEAATKPAADSGIRVVNGRFGVVLSARGGALARMVGPFKMGVGGRLGSGTQWMSWIAIDDLVGAVLYALASDDLKGPVNVTSPNPVTNAAFTETLGRVLARPTALGVPAFALRLAFGEIADAALLASQRAEPRRLLDAGYAFQYPELEGALRHLLGT